MRAPTVMIDFAAPRARVTLLGVVLLVLGAAVAAGTYAEYRLLTARRAGLELKLEAANRHNRHEPGADARSVGFAEAAGRMAAELGTPWTA
ncbi:MAG: hypothetical protein E6K46_07315, partial [Gammaproteobacteria bacterium]